MFLQRFSDVQDVEIRHSRLNCEDQGKVMIFKSKSYKTSSVALKNIRMLSVNSGANESKYTNFEGERVRSPGTNFLIKEVPWVILIESGFLFSAIDLLTLFLSALVLQRSNLFFCTLTLRRSWLIISSTTLNTVLNREELSS
jgi:hypothetical protein